MRAGTLSSVVCQAVCLPEASQATRVIAHGIPADLPNELAFHYPSLHAKGNPSPMLAGKRRSAKRLPPHALPVGGESGVTGTSIPSPGPASAHFRTTVRSAGQQVSGAALVRRFASERRAIGSQGIVGCAYESLRQPPVAPSSPNRIGVLVPCC